MDEQDNKVIPINIHLINAMKGVLKELRELPWKRPKQFNAIFVDRKGFMKMDKVPNPPPPIWQYAILPRLNLTVERDPYAYAPACERASFYFYRRIGDSLEYREE